MPHAITWLLPNRIIYFRVHGTVTSAELPDTDSAVLTMLDESDADKIHILFDDSDLVKMPGINEMMSLKYIRHARVGWIITPQRNAFIRFVGSVVGQTAGVKFRFVDSLEGGLKTLSKMDLSLPSMNILSEHLATVSEKVRRSQ